MACRVNEVIERALRDGEPAYRARGILVDAKLECTIALATVEPMLEQALYSIFRGLPERLARGATLRIWTRDRAGGDIELAWEAHEETAAPDADAHPLTRGPYGDLLELALDGLSAFCRARAGHVETDEGTLQDAPAVHRRYFVLIPSLRREPGWSPLKRS